MGPVYHNPLPYQPVIQYHESIMPFQGQYKASQMIIYKYHSFIRFIYLMILEPTTHILAENYREEIRILISKLDSMLNYIKQYNLIVSVCIRQPKTSTKTMLTSLISQFDHCVEQYCTYYINIRLKHALYFMIDPLAFESNQNRGVITKNHNLNSSRINFKNGNLGIKSIQNQNFQFRLVCIKDTQQKYNIEYRMHLEIWKKNGVDYETNQILTMFEETFMFDLFYKLYNEGYISHFLENCGVYLNYKKSKLPYSLSIPFYNKTHRNKQHAQQSNILFEFLEQELRKYLQSLTDLYQNKLFCVFCNRNLMFDSRKNKFLPPTIKIEAISQKFQSKFFHEQCSLKYLFPLKKPLLQQTSIGREQMTKKKLQEQNIPGKQI